MQRERRGGIYSDVGEREKLDEHPGRVARLLCSLEQNRVGLQYFTVFSRYKEQNSRL